MKSIAVLALSLVLAGCSLTPYQPMKSIGGYDDLKVGSDSWRVRAKVNNSSNISRADDIALLRASELACQNGYESFNIVNQFYDRGRSIKDTAITVRMSHHGEFDAKTLMKQLSEKLETTVSCSF